METVINLVETGTYTTVSNRSWMTLYLSFIHYIEIFSDAVASNSTASFFLIGFPMKPDVVRLKTNVMVK